MLHISLFSGIGGFELAAEWMGWKNIVSCEINPFGRKILDYYWPEAYHHDDIHTLTYDTINAELTRRFGPAWRNEEILLSGGFPCQPFSMAGHRKGTEDDRHLWPEMRRLIQEIKPTWILGENVHGIISWDKGVVFESVQAELEADGYEVQPYVLPAAGIGAPHKRLRVWFVAHAIDNISRRALADTTGEQSERLQPEQREDSQPQQKQFRRGGGQVCDTILPADTDSSGCGQGNRPSQLWSDLVGKSSNDSRLPNPEEDGEGSQGIGREQVSADTCDEGLQGRKEYRDNEGEIREGKQHSDATRYVSSTWENFPTEPPVCSRDDGVSFGLDPKTFSRWRTNSIKAFGNAIVPQVAFMIFNAIEEWQRLYADKYK